MPEISTALETWLAFNRNLPPRDQMPPTATRDEARALSDEGIEFFPLPILPEDQN